MPEQIDAVDTVTESMFKMKMSGLTIFVESREMSNLDIHSLDFIIDAYCRAYSRLLEYVLGEKKGLISLQSFPAAQLILTRNPDIFRVLYHTPDRFDFLPDWVQSYVNIEKCLYVILLDKNTDYSLRKVNEHCHEFVHIIIADVFDIPSEFLSTVWPIWLKEAFSVGANQRCSDSWLQTELSRLEKDLTIAGVVENGIFYYDQRMPDKNVAYQYCVRVAEEFGKGLTTTIPDTLSCATISPPPLLAICSLTKEAFDERYNLWERVEKLGIKVETCEDAVRKKLGLYL